MLSEGRMRRASLRDRAFDPWPRAAQPWTTQDADAMRSGKTCAYLLNIWQRVKCATAGLFGRFIHAIFHGTDWRWG